MDEAKVRPPNPRYNGKRRRVPHRLPDEYYFGRDSAKKRHEIDVAEKAAGRRSG
jgi:hypothetical protein